MQRRRKDSTAARRTNNSASPKPRKVSLANEDDFDVTIPPSLDQPVHTVSQPDKFDALYTRGQELGLGAFAEVFLGVHKPSKREYAIKKIDRSKMIWGDRDALEDEINSLIYVREGPNIVQLYDVYKEKLHCYLVMELCRGKELFDRILEKKIFTEKQARDCCRDILRGLEYMHERRVAHRDLKPENLLMLTVEPDSPVKLADFGFAKKVVMHNGLRTLCGTPGYLAPEILERWPAYDTGCDLWSVGVILFLLLGGYLPFEDDNEDLVFEHTRNGQYDFHPNYWKHVSIGAKSLVTKLLTVNPKKRFSAQQALASDWMNKTDDVVKDGELTVKKIETLRKRHALTGKQKMKAAVKSIMAINRMKNLQKNFAGYLERQQSSSRLTTGDSPARKPHRRFEEDSKSGIPFSNFYDLGDILGEGGYACVYRAMHKQTQELFAVKDINTSVLEKNSKSALKDEIAALKLLRGLPHIIRLYDVFEEPQHTYMVMEECKGGDLLTRVSEKEVYTEREARATCRILFQAMDFIHKKKIAHRDIKPENVLMVNPDDDATIKIADFGFAKRVPKPNCLRTLCGTAQYVAPEVLDLQSVGYDQRADMWSVGVVVYILLGGYAPFEGPVQELARAICKGAYCFHDKYWHDISDEAKNMISNLLQIDVDCRLSAEEAMQCPWMIIEEEELTIKDLSGAQTALANRKHTDGGHVLKPLNKYESLDVSFTSSLGTFEEVMTRRAKRTSMGNDLGTLDEESSYIEDSSSGKSFESLYKWGRLIGEGNFSVVHETRHCQSKEIFAVKRIQRTDLGPEDAVSLQDEISTLQRVSDSPFIVKLHDVFDEPDYTYMVMERLQGGVLLDRIVEKSYYTEDEARVVLRKVLMGLEHCHNRRVVNRNIKAENLILTEKDSYIDVKISDFGFAKRVLFPNALKTQIGTEGYVAPEILEHRPAYDVQCDMWSVGVLMYMLLGGYRPFRGEAEEVARQTRYGEYKFHKRYWKNISEEATVLISRMLTVNPIGRITATAALQSDWILNEGSDYDDATSDDDDGKGNS